MSRSHVRGIAISVDPLTGYLKRIQTPTIRVYEPGTTTSIAQVMYNAPAGGTAKANPFTGDANGGFEFWIPRPQTVKIVATGALGETVTIDNEEAQGLNTVPGVSLFELANGATIWDGTTDSDAAWTAAFAALPNGGILNCGEGTILAPTSSVMATCANNTWIVGTGPGTIWKHRNNSSTGVFSFYGKSYCGVLNGTVDGNYANNHALSDGFISDSEIVFRPIATTGVGGVGCVLTNVTVQNFNCYGVLANGTQLTISSSRFFGMGSGPYGSSVTGGGATSRDWRSVYGVVTAGGNGISDKLTIKDCYFWGMRSAGVLPGGTKVRLLNCEVEQSHLGYWPDATAGGQVGINTTDIAYNNTTQKQSQDVTIENLIVGPTAATAPANGLEVGLATDVMIINPKIQVSQLGGGIIMGDPVLANNAGAARVQIIGGEIRTEAATLAAGTSGEAIQINHSRVVQISNMIIRDCRVAGVRILGSLSDYITLSNNVFSGITGGTNLVDTSGSTQRDYMNNRCVDGTAIDNILSAGLTISNGLLSANRTAGAGAYAATFRNTNTAGAGAYTRAGSAASGTSIHDFIRESDGAVVAQILASGSAIIAGTLSVNGALISKAPVIGATATAYQMTTAQANAGSSVVCDAGTWLVLGNVNWLTATADSGSTLSANLALTAGTGTLTQLGTNYTVPSASVIRNAGLMFGSLVVAAGNTATINLQASKSAGVSGTGSQVENGKVMAFYVGKP